MTGCRRCWPGRARCAVPEPAAPQELRALVVDYGGVLTSPVVASIGAWCETDGVDPAAFGAAMKAWRVEDPQANPVHDLETGALSGADFERGLAARLRTRDGQPVPAEGLLARMFAGFGEEPLMVSVLRRARTAGLRTALLSNSWGNDYPREQWPELFDAVVISGEVGLRKPQPEIYLLAASRLGLAPRECVFVDDLPANVRGASAVGMVGVEHTDPARTVDELDVLFGVGLRGLA